MSTIVTAMKTAKTTRSPITISDCARSTTRDPTMLIPAIATTTREVKTLSQPAGCVLADEERGRVAAEGDSDHRADDHDGGEIPEPGSDTDEAAVSEALHQVGEKPARGRVANAELHDGVAEQPGDDPGQEERQPDRRAGDDGSLAEQGEDAGPDHRADAEEGGASDAQVTAPSSARAARACGRRRRGRRSRSRQAG